MTDAFAQGVALAAGALLLTTALLVWRHSLPAAVTVLTAQGWVLAGLVLVIGLDAGSAELVAVAGVVVGVKGVLVPWLLRRAVTVTRATTDSSRLNPTAGLLGVAALTGLAFVVAGPALVPGEDVASRAAPVGLAMVLVGFLQLVTRRRALSQMVAFLLLDNGIAAIAFLTAGGVPLIVELGVSLDVVLVLLVLLVLSGRMRDQIGGTDLDDLKELRD